MTSSLKDRVRERMLATGLTNAQLALAADVKQPTSFNWASGKTKAIKGEPLLKAADALGVTPTWLATGKGPKFPQQTMQSGPLIAMDLAIPLYPEEPDRATRAAQIVRALPPSAAAEALNYLEWLLAKNSS